MRPSPPTKPSTAEPPRGSWLRFLLTMFVILGGLLIGAMIFPPFFAIVCVLAIVITGQYFIWGWWMERFVRDEKPRPEDGSEPTPLPHERSDIELPRRDL